MFTETSLIYALRGISKAEDEDVARAAVNAAYRIYGAKGSGSTFFGTNGEHLLYKRGIKGDTVWGVTVNLDTKEIVSIKEKGTVRRAAQAAPKQKSTVKDDVQRQLFSQRSFIPDGLL
jgi:hypothetical protein